MKKLLIVAFSAFVAACSCFECDEPAPAVAYQSARKTQLDCDYFDGKTCYRYVYRNIQRPVAQPAPVRQRPCGTTNPPCSCKSYESNTTGGCGCEPKITETREPVEIVYKKTTYKTVYEPKTYSQVSYEKVPCAGCTSANETAEVVKAPNVVESTKVVIDDIK